MAAIDVAGGNAAAKRCRPGMHKPIPVRTVHRGASNIHVCDSGDAQRVGCGPGQAVEVPCLAQAPEEVGAVLHLLRLIGGRGVLPIVRRADRDVPAHDRRICKALLRDQRTENESAHRMAHNVDAFAAAVMEVLYSARDGRRDLLDRRVGGEAELTAVVAER